MTDTTPLIEVDNLRVRLNTSRGPADAVRGVSFSLALYNVTNRTANRFAFGNPFTLSVRDQATPLRPRNLRLGISAQW